MRRVRVRILAAIIALMGVVAVSACAGAGAGGSTVTFSPEPPPSSAAPLFATDAAALAAATKAYRAYITVTDQIMIDGGKHPERAKKVETGALLKTDLQGFAVARGKELHMTGRSSFGSVKLQQYDRRSASDTIVVYLCVDVSAVDVVNDQGRSIVSADRPDVAARVVSFDTALTAKFQLLPSRSDTWRGQSYCSN